MRALADLPLLRRTRDDWLSMKGVKDCFRTAQSVFTQIVCLTFQNLCRMRSERRQDPSSFSPSFLGSRAKREFEIVGFA